MRIGVPKEIKNHEYRVGLVPAGVRELVVMEVLPGTAIIEHTVAELSIGDPSDGEVES